MSQVHHHPEQALPHTPLLLSSFCRGKANEQVVKAFLPAWLCIKRSAHLTSEIGSGSTTAHIWLGFGLNSLILNLQAGGRARRTHLSHVPSLLDWKVWEMPNS